MFGRFIAQLVESEPESVAQWTREIFIQKWGPLPAKCRSCGAGLREWQVGGHNMDRISNSRLHIPGNCRAVCWPCNRTKSNKNAAAASIIIDSYLIPWCDLDPAFRPAKPPDVSEFRVEVQLSLWGTR